MAPPWTHDDDRVEDWGDDPDAPQDEDLDDEDDETPTVPCPSCRQPVADIAERCPHCGDWIVPGGPTSGRARWWVIAAAILALAGLLAWQWW